MKFGTRVVLLLGFGGVLALMSIAGWNSIQVFQQIEVRNTSITDDYLNRHHLLDQIRSFLYMSGSLARDYLLDPTPAAARKHLTGLENLHEEINSAVAKYERSQLPEETALVSELHSNLADYWNALSAVFRWSPEEKRVKSYTFFESDVVPRRVSLLRIADNIEAINEGALREGDRQSAEVVHSFRQRIAVILAITLGLGFGLAALSIAYILRLERDARIRYQEILLAQNELQQLSARLVQAQEEERRAISRELHDEVGQSLSAVLVDLGNLVAVTPPENTQTLRLLSTVKREAEESLKEVRNMSLLLRPSMLDDFGLVPALRWQARELYRRTGMFVDVNAEDTADELPDEHRTTIYRVVQEALHNCSRHAAAKTVHITLEQNGERLILTIQDDGKGFDSRRTRGLGLVGMEERVRHLGGLFELHSQPGRGTVLKIELPLPVEHPQQAELSL